ncbi:MAG: hypothetical protein ABFD91_19265 [Anaerohalosphaeraceae bacterium]
MLLDRADQILRGYAGAADGRASKNQLAGILIVLFIFGCLYGAVMGLYSLIYGHRFLQLVYSATKVPLLLLASFGLSLPFFFVLNSLLGLRDDFFHSLRALLATQAGLTIILSSLSPLTLLWYISFDNYNSAILFNAVIFGCSSVLAQTILMNLLGPLIQKNQRHRITLLAWLIIYAFVGIQMSWILRPFIGDPKSPTHFFRQDAWGNAYIKLIQIITGLFSA